MKVFDTPDKDRIASLAKRVNETSSADFVKRLIDQRRQYLVNDDGSFSTHELAYRDDGKGNAVVYPQVQSVQEGLHRFDDDMAYDRAVYRGDTLRMSTPDAKLFTENYKSQYPMYFQPELAPYGTLESAYNMAPPESRPLWTPYEYDVSSPEVAVASVLDPKKDAARRIMAVENSKNHPGGGWDAKTGRWYPHKSVEGGADTIAYGIKLSNGTPEAALALKQGYLTDEQAESAVDTLVQKYYDAAKRVYDKKYGDGEWDKLSDKSQSILVDYSYNPGLAKFPSLMEGFHSGNMDLIRKNYKRYSGGKPLGRNKVLLQDIDDLENNYSIFRAEGGKIHIAPSKRGTFTAAAKRHGKSVQAFASQVLAHKENYSPAMVKKANFARNASKWKHGDGGPLDKYGDDAVRAALIKLRQSNNYDGESKKTGLMRRLASLPVRVPNMTGTATGAMTGLRDIPLVDSTVGKEAAVVGTAILSPFAGHLLNVLGNPAAALTDSGAALSSLADAYGLVSGLNEVRRDADKAIAGDYGADDIPHTLLNGFAFLPGSSQFTKAENLAQLSNGWRGLTAYPRGVGKRAAEVAVRMGDAAENPSRYPEQFFNKTAMRYVFDPKADPNLAYNLPFKYSGESAGDLMHGGAHKGDIVDQFFGKTPVPNASYDRSLLPERMQEYLLRSYPGKNVPIVDLGDAHTLFRYDSALNPVANESEMQNLVESLTELGPVRTGARSGGLYKNGHLVLDPGGFDFTATKVPDGYRIDGLDIWKYKPAEYSKAYLGQWSPKRMIQRAGLKFIDRQGTPIIHKWHETVPNLSGR